MHSEYTLIPIAKRDELIEKLQWLKADIEAGNSIPEMLTLQVNSVQTILNVWTDWDDECRRIIGEAEETICTTSATTNSTQLTDVSTLEADALAQ